MKTNLCNFCLKSEIFCSSCQKKIKTGAISNTDLKIARMLLSLETKYPSLQNIYFHKAVETNKILAIVVGQGDKKHLLDYGGAILKALGKKIEKRLLVLEQRVDNRKFLEDLFAPFSIVTINRIWIPDGTTETRVILRRRKRQSRLMNIEEFKEIAKKLRGITLRVEFT